MWRRGIKMKANLDVIMHIIFLGIIKTVVRMVMHWCKRRDKLNELLDRLKGTPEALMELNIEWLELLPFLGGKIGGMVSENYMAMFLAMPWLFHELRSVAKDFVFIPPMNKSIWTAVECRRWLCVRDLPRSNMNANELRATVKRYKSLINGPPDSVQDKGGAVRKVEVMIEALHSMVCTIM
jgi:hypothetical protein